MAQSRGAYGNSPEFGDGCTGKPKASLAAPPFMATGDMNNKSDIPPAAARRTRILVVDDHPMIRERLSEVIQREPELTVCGEAEDNRSALKAAEATNPDLIIVDLTLKNSDGLDLIKDLRVWHPKLPILVISMHDEVFLAERAIRAGAQGYITKQEATKNVLLAIRTVLKGQVYLSETMALRLASKVAKKHGSRTSLDLLTDREMRVFQLIGQGKGTRQIASDMGVHISTVQTYRARIKEKLQLENADDLRQQAIRLARGTV